MFHVGQRVKCVQNEKEDWKRNAYGRKYDGPSYGEELIVDAVDVFPHPETGERVQGLAFVKYGVENYYDSRTFRPIIERETDISALTALLNPANHKKLEDA